MNSAGKLRGDLPVSFSTMRWLRWILFVLLVSLAIGLISVPAFWNPPATPPWVRLDQFEDFKFDPLHGTVADIPQSVRQYDGRVVVLDGIMVPTKISPMQMRLLPYTEPRETGLDDSLEKRVDVTIMPGTQAVNLIGLDEPRELGAKGVFHISLVRDDQHKIVSLFHLDAKQITLPTAIYPYPERMPIWMANARTGGIWLLCSTVLVFIVLSIATRITRRSSRLLDGLCVGCGYDLRATPDRCPECGATARSP